MDLRTTFATQAYDQARASTPISPDLGTQANDTGAGQVFQEAMQSLAATVQNGENIARASMTTGANPHALVTALAQTELAVETAVTIRDRVVEAYQEILRMPV
ncbi:MAG: flagellar hook-basal body complex protein FliE [Pseudomonadota bacterium]